MAKTLSTSGINSGQLIRTTQLTQVVDALTGNDDYDISITGSLIVSGSTDLFGTTSGSFIGDGTGLTGVTGEWDGTHDGNADITGSLTVTSDVSSSGNLFGDRIFAASYVATPTLQSSTSDTVLIDDNLNVLYNITASSDISASGTITALSGSFSELSGASPLTINGIVNFSNPITSSGNISSSGDLFVSNAQFGSSTVYINGPAGHISASGLITASSLFLTDGKFGIKIDTDETAYNPPNTYGGNVSIGSFAGNSLSDNDLGNVIIGNRAGYTTTNNYNVFVGYKSGYEQPGGNNIFIGTQAGYYGDTYNEHNVAIGYEALMGVSSSNHDSQNNVVIGKRAGKLVQNGDNNVIIGSLAGYDITGGDNNIIIGPSAASGSGNMNSQLIIGSGSLATISASLTTGDIIFPGSASFTGLPTSEPTTTGSLWISGSSPNHPNSGYLMIFNP